MTILHPAHLTDLLLFDLRTPDDTAWKAQRELRRFAHAATIEDRTDHAINLAVTAWHALEGFYLWARANAPAKVAAYTDVEAYRQAVRVICPQFKTMKDIATAMKHRQLTYTPVTRTAHVSAMDPSDPAAGVAFDYTQGTSTVRDPAGVAFRHKVSDGTNIRTFMEVGAIAADFLVAEANRLMR